MRAFISLMRQLFHFLCLFIDVHARYASTYICSSIIFGTCIISKQYYNDSADLIFQEPFPLHAICGSVWKNVEGQLSFLKYAVSAPPEIFTFAHSERQLVCLLQILSCCLMN